MLTGGPPGLDGHHLRRHRGERQRCGHAGDHRVVRQRPFEQQGLDEKGKIIGQLKPTGLIGADTQAAIVKFERARKLPLTGQMSDRLVRELGAMTGRPVE